MLIAEAHSLEARADIYFRLISDTNIQEVNRSDSTDIDPDSLHFIRVNDEQEVL